MRALLLFILFLPLIAFAQKAEDYKCFLAKADSAYEFHFALKESRPELATKYIAALDLYKRANALSPSENYPKERIKEISRVVEQLRNKQLLETADSLFIAQNYKKAEDAYLRVGKSFPLGRSTSRAALCKDLISLEPVKAKKMTELVLSGDGYFNSLNVSIRKRSGHGEGATADDTLVFNLARSSYEKALEISPGAKYPAQKLEELLKLDWTTSKGSAGDNIAKHEAIIARGDKAFNDKDYAIAIGYYTDTLKIHPPSKSAQQKLEEAEKLLKERTK